MFKTIDDQQGRIIEFYELLYNGADTTKEKFKIAILNNGYSRNVFINDIIDIIEILNLYNHSHNIYLEVPTIKTSSFDGTRSSLAKRYYLFFDFDKKEIENLSINMIQNRFNELGLWYHAIIDSGNGYHAYMLIEPTDNIEMVDKVQKKLGELLGADTKALCTTQLARVFGSFNVKDTDNHKFVNLIFSYNKDTIKRYSIEHLWKYKCNTEFETDENTTLILTGDMTPCVSRALREGSKEGSREADLYNITMYYKLKGYNINQALYQLKQWNTLNNSPLEEGRIEYKVNYIFENCRTYNCNDCINKCKKYVKSDFNREQYEENIITLSKSCLKKKKGGIEMIKLSGNELFIYNVLLNNMDFNCTLDLIMERITDRKTKKAVLNKETVRILLKSLEEMNVVEVIKGNRRLGISDTYKLKRKNLTDLNSFPVSYFINVLVIKGDISTTDMKVYIAMLYLHHKRGIKGNIVDNLFQEDLSTLTGIDQSDISRHLDILWQNHVLDRVIKLTENRNVFKYTYKLNV